MKIQLLYALTGVFATTSGLASEQEKALLSPPAAELQKAGCQKVWSGIPARIRIYDQPASTGRKVFLYLGSGSTFDYVGWTDRDHMFEVITEALNQGSLTGYTNSSCKIEWMDYRGL